MRHCSLLKPLISVPVSLLSFLIISSATSGSLAADSVGPGPLLEKRKEVFAYLQKVKSKGVGTKPYEVAFDQIEADVAAGKGEADIKKQLSSLIVSLSAQANSARDLKIYGVSAGGGSSSPADLAKYKNVRGTAVPTSVMEGIIFDCVNKHRKEAGLSSIPRNGRLDGLAREQANDMAKREYFSHTNPEHKGPMERAAAHGMPDISIFENIASVSRRGQNGIDMARVADQILMDSSGHKANIMNPKNSSCGIGVAYNKFGWIKVCQVFSFENP